MYNSRQNAHGTEIAEGRTVAYLWHPWVGQAVHVHQIIEKTTGTLARCSLAVDPIVRTQVIPIWMLDETVCRATRAMSHPFAALEALAALRSLLSNVMAAQASARATIASPDHNRGDRHGTPSPSPASNPGSSIRPLRGEPAVDAQGAPGWSTLPHQTRSAVTGLVTRLLIEHAGGETRDRRSDADEF